MNLSNILFNEFGRLRSGWRFAILVLVFIAINLALTGITSALYTYFPFAWPRGNAVLMAQSNAVSLAAALAAGWFCAWYLEQLPFRSLGLWFTRGWFRNFGLGILIGALTVTLAVSMAAAFPTFGLQTNSVNGTGQITKEMLFLLLLFVVGAAFEEALFRGYMLQTFARAGLSWLAIALTSIFFAIVHLGNPDANAISTLNTALAGVWFSIAYLKTRDLWFPIGLHFIWNWMQGSVFGIEVSGIKDLIHAPLMREIDAGPQWVTGGEYGIEGGIVATVALVISFAVIYFLPFPKGSKELYAMTSKENPTAILPGS